MGSKVSKSTAKRVFKRDDWRCHYCKLTVSKDVPHMHPRLATVDHKTPLARGGDWSDANLTCACAKCNGTKGNMPYEAFLWYRHMLVRGEQPLDLIAAVEIVFGPVQSWVRYYAAWELEQLPSAS